MRSAVISLLVVAMVALVIASPVRGDGWMEANSHHNSEPEGDYHVHAHVKAWAYMGGDSQCHYNSWSHTIGDTWVDETEGYSYYKSQFHNTEWGWTDVDIILNELTVDDEYAELIDFTYYCPA